VVSLGQIRGGTAHNVIPNEVFLQSTIRSHEETVREQLWAEIERALSLSKPLGSDYKLEITKGYPAMFNDVRVNGWIRDVVADLAGETAVNKLLASN
jgi:metal-dependent amidase/aminoacylase/carboxypeptidase family protein